jgi:hypothetical protein
MGHCLATVESDKQKLREKLAEASWLAMRLAASDYVSEQDQRRFKEMMTALDSFGMGIF